MALYVGECRRCGAQNMTFQVYGISHAGDFELFDSSIHRTVHVRLVEFACRCPDCQKTTVFLFRHTADDSHKLAPKEFNQYQNPKALGYELFNAFPAKAAPPTPADTPKLAGNFYQQGVTALAHGLNDAAGAMFRKCLEAATLSKELLEAVPMDEREAFKKLWLKARLKKLKELHAIPPALGDLVDVIKDEGDTAVHENELYDKDSAEALQRFTKTFLEQMFTLPAEIKSVRKKKT